jgi:uncharacterized protein (UPF0303 family)
MGLGLRIFIINDDDTVRRFPFSRYERLLHVDSKERLLQYPYNLNKDEYACAEFLYCHPRKL